MMAGLCSIPELECGDAFIAPDGRTHIHLSHERYASWECGRLMAGFVIIVEGGGNLFVDASPVVRASAHRDALG